MGSYASAVGKRSFAEQIPQMLYSGMKVPMLIVVTLVVSIPSFYVINTLLGLRGRFSGILTVDHFRSGRLDDHSCFADARDGFRVLVVVGLRGQLFSRCAVQCGYVRSSKHLGSVTIAKIL